MELSALSDEFYKEMFQAEPSSVPVQLKKNHKASVLWLNERAMRLDPAFAKLHGNAQKYEDYILDKCAFEIDSGSGTVVGWADRYGGEGIGTCGGSGRAAFVNGYHVKGIGLTPLVGLRADTVHSTGRVCLSEAVREAIYAEAMSQHPWSSVPVLAIVDTRSYQYWDRSTGWLGPPKERQVLLVRPPILRSAHFQRAERLIVSIHKAGLQDARRVAHNVSIFKKYVGSDGFLAAIEEFWTRFAEQMAYSLVNGLTQNNYSTSNITLAGAFLDFGSARVKLYKYKLSQVSNMVPVTSDVNWLRGSIWSMFESLALYGGVQYQHDTIANKALAAFENSFLLSLIRNTTKISPVGISESSLISLMLERLRQDDISKQLLQAAFATGLAHSSPQSADSTQMAFNSHIDRMLERLMPPNFARDIKGEQISYIGPEFDTSELDILDRDRLICDIENFLHPDSLDFSYCGYGLDQFIKARIPKKVKLCLSRGDFH